MRANEFLEAFSAALPERFDPGLSPKVRAWTSWISVVLHDTKESLDLRCCCRMAEGPQSHRTKWSAEADYHREYLYDLSWYAKDGWEEWSRPVVAIEHENVWSYDAFIEDFWKLAVSGVPLRVMFGYAKHQSGLDKYVDRLAKTSARWEHPSYSEDVVLLGRGDMATPRDFRVLLRPAGEKAYREGGLPSPVAR